jgi:hypothetical protein
MDLTLELDSVASDLLKEFPEVAVRYDVPIEPQAGTFVIRSQHSDLSVESRYTFRIERDYQLIYYSADPQDAIEIMNRYARRCLKGNTLIPILDDSLRYIRINSFGYGLPVKTEMGLYMVMAMMPTELRQARDQETYQKIMKVQFTIKSIEIDAQP